MESNLKIQEELIQAMVASYNQYDVLSISRQINIDSTEFYSESMPIRQLVDKFVTRAFQLDKGYELFNKFKELRRNMISTSSVSDRSAEIFGRLLNHYLNSFSDMEEKDFEESELFDPIEFEEKMKTKAKFDEDNFRKGVRLKADIVVLRKKAYALDYKKYKDLIQKLARYYKYNICVKYPVKDFDANIRFAHLYNSLISMVPDELYEKDVMIEEYVEGIIFDTISKCLIFNE